MSSGLHRSVIVWLRGQVCCKPMPQEAFACAKVAACSATACHGCRTSHIPKPHRAHPHDPASLLAQTHRLHSNAITETSRPQHRPANTRTTTREATSCIATAAGHQPGLAARGTSGPASASPCAGHGRAGRAWAVKTAAASMTTAQEPNISHSKACGQRARDLTLACNGSLARHRPLRRLDSTLPASGDCGASGRGFQMAARGRAPAAARQTAQPRSSGSERPSARCPGRRSPRLRAGTAARAPHHHVHAAGDAPPGQPAGSS